MPDRKNVLMSDEAQVNIGALQQRVFGLESAMRALGDSQSSLASRVETLFAGLSSKIEERSRPQYPLLISIGLFGLAVIAAVGGLAYAPIRENQSDLKLAMVEMAKTVGSLGEKFVSIRELDGRSSRTRSEMDRVNSDLKALEAVTVPRGEHTERWRGFDASVLGLQRQIDEQNKKFGDTFSLRNALQQMQRRIDQLEASRRGPSCRGLLLSTLSGHWNVRYPAASGSQSIRCRACGPKTRSHRPCVRMPGRTAAQPGSAAAAAASGNIVRRVKLGGMIEPSLPVVLPIRRKA